MSDEDNVTALNENEEVNVDTTPVSEATEDVEMEPTEPTGEEGEIETETGEQPELKKGYSARVRELNQKAKQAEEKAFLAEEKVKSLSEKIAELTGGLPEPENYIPQVTPGTEISPDDYRNDVVKTAGTIVNLRMKQQEALHKIQTSTEKTVAKYPELDPDSPDYDKELSQSVTEAVEAHVKMNPYTSNVEGFVDRLMKPYKRAVTKEVGQAGEKLAKQVSQTATRPTNLKSNEKTAEDKSIEELEKELGIVY